MRRERAIGIDLGATTIKGGIVDSAGTILSRVTLDTLADRGPEAVLGQLSRSIRELLSQNDGSAILGIGIGAPGVVADDGVVKYPPNFSDWTEINLRENIQRQFKLPVDVENDANVAALGEAKFGAGTHHKDFLFVIWGTGVGGGIILDGEIFRGPYGGAGEIGHVVIDYNGPPCNCGNRGCVEAYVGQRYLSARTRERLAVPSKIIELADGDLDRIEPYIISRAAQQGDPLAHEILREAGELLGVAITSVLNVLDLRVVIIGGGISAAEPFVFEAIEQSIRSRILKGSRDHIRVLPASLGNAAGILGAARLPHIPWGSSPRID